MKLNQQPDHKLASRVKIFEKLSEKFQKGTFLTFYCASFKTKNIKIRSVQFEIQGGDKQTNKQRDHDALGTPPSPPQTRSTSFRSARFASLATRVTTWGYRDV